MKHFLSNFVRPLPPSPPALCHFSESILEYLANLDKAPDPTVRKDTFSSEIYAAFDILFNNWLQSRESKVRSQSSLLGVLSKMLWYATEIMTQYLTLSHVVRLCRRKLR